MKYFIERMVVWMSNEELVQEYQSGNHQALDELIQQNTGLVFYFANKYFPLCSMTPMDIDDLVQEGWIGFLDAAKKYDPNKPLEEEEEAEPCLDDPDAENKTVMFSSYAGRAIQNKMLRSINTKIPREKKSDTYSEPIKVNSINSLIPGADEVALEEVLPDYESMRSYKDIEKHIDNQILRKDLLQLLDSVFGGEFQHNGTDFNGVENIESLNSKLNDGITAKEVLLLHYGLFRKEMSFQEIGELVGLSGSRIGQIEFQGIYKIRNSIEGQQFLKEYEDVYFNDLLRRKEEINEYQKPNTVVGRIEYFDELLEEYI